MAKLNIYPGRGFVLLDLSDDNGRAHFVCGYENTAALRDKLTAILDTKELWAVSGDGDDTQYAEGSPWYVDPSQCMINR